MPLATTWMELENIMLSEIRERQIPYYFTHIGIYGKEKERERKTKNHTLNYREQNDGYQRGG